jgi:hypothetical protein
MEDPRDRDEAPNAVRLLRSLEVIYLSGLLLNQRVPDQLNRALAVLVASLAPAAALAPFLGSRSEGRYFLAATAICMLLVYVLIDRNKAPLKQLYMPGTWQLTATSRVVIALAPAAQLLLVVGMSRLSIWLGPVALLMIAPLPLDRWARATR